LLSPIAILAIVMMFVALGVGALQKARLASQVSSGLLLAATTCFAFALGALMAETRFPFGEVGASDLTFPLLPVVLLGLLSGRVAIRFLRPTMNCAVPPCVTSRSIDIDKAVSSASQVSLAVVVLIGLGISQTAGYAGAISELISVRKAFAEDLVADRIDSSTAWSTNKTREGEVTVFARVSDVPWASISIIEKQKGSLYRVEVEEHLSGERWSLPAWSSKAASSARTQQVADRHGVKFDSAESAERIFPRIDAHLRAKDIAFPGVGLSFELKTFTVVAPLVVSAMLIILAYRVRSAAWEYAHIKEPWILIEAERGAAGALAWAWIACIALGPFIMGVLLVEVMALTHKARGFSQGLIADSLATAYALVTLVLLILPAKSCVDSLLKLRAKVKHERTCEL
jgi:hypothetical protein